MKAILCILFAYMSHMAWASEDVSLRLVPSFFDEATQTVYVDVEIRYNGIGDFHLADQNIRLFYDANQLELVKDHSRSDLPQDLYSTIQWHEVMEDLKADHINQLNYDNELGFVNFSIDLYENIEGGISIAQEHSWQRIAVLNFKVDDKEAVSQINWSNPKTTSGYATAFVKVMEWKGPNEIRAAEVDTYIDAAFNTDDESIAVDMTVYPNPVVSITNFSFDKVLERPLNIRIIDMLGREAISQTASAGIQEIQLDVSHLMAGEYQVEVRDIDTEKVISSEHLMKVD